MATQLRNFINGQWKASEASEFLTILNPATQEPLAEVPLSPASEVGEAAAAAQHAFIEWRRTPVGDRIQYLFKLKTLLEENIEALEIGRASCRERV